MLQRFVTSLLNEYLSSIVQLDSEQIKFGVWSGNLHLTNLLIKNELFNNLPFELIRGIIGRFELQLNWAKISSVPIQITIEHLYLLLKPKINQIITEKQLLDYINSTKQ